jgi:hypothetical protein
MRHLSLSSFIHHVFLLGALHVWCMNFYKNVLSQMILRVVSTSFSRYVGTLLEVIFHLPYCTMKKMGVLQLALQLNFWIAPNNCNSLYLYIVSANVSMVQFIVTRLQFSQNNSFSTIMQFHYNYTVNAMLMSLIVVHLSKYDTWYYEDIWT